METVQIRTHKTIVNKIIPKLVSTDILSENSILVASGG